MSNSVVSPGSRPTRWASKPGIRRSSPMTSGIRSLLPPSNGTPSLVPSKPMMAQSPTFAGRSSTAERVAFWSRISSSTVSTLASSIGLDLGREVEVRVVAQGHRGADLDRRLEPERLALLRLDDLDVGVGQRHDALGEDRVPVGGLDERVDGLLEDGRGPEDALEDRARRLAGPEAGHARAARQARHGVADGPVEPVGGDLDLEDDGALGSGGGRHIHRRASIGWVAGRGGPGRAGARRRTGAAAEAARLAPHGRVAKWQTRRP